MDYKVDKAERDLTQAQKDYVSTVKDVLKEHPWQHYAITDRKLCGNTFEVSGSEILCVYYVRELEDLMFVRRTGDKKLKEIKGSDFEFTYGLDVYVAALQSILWLTLGDMMEIDGHSHKGTACTVWNETDIRLYFYNGSEVQAVNDIDAVDETAEGGFYCIKKEDMSLLEEHLEGNDERDFIVNVAIHVTGTRKVTAKDDDEALDIVRDMLKTDTLDNIRDSLCLLTDLKVTRVINTE